MKKIKLLIIFLISCFVLEGSVYADQHTQKCTYKDSTGVIIEAALRIKANNIYADYFTFVSTNVSGSVDAFLKDAINNARKYQIRNWDTPFLEGSSFSGKNYYANNKNCPPIAVITKSFTGHHAFVSDEASYNTIVNAIQKKYTTEGKIYRFDLATTSNQSQEKVDTPNSCMDFNQTPNAKYKNGTCEKNDYFACIWVETDSGGYCNVNNLQYVKCGGAYDIPAQAPEVVSLVINFLKITGPILLVLLSVITLIKALGAQKDDEITKAKNTLIKRLVAAVMLFFVIYIVQFVLLKVAEDSEKGGIRSCLSCFVNNDCETNKYYKTNVYGLDICTYLDGTELECGDN